MAVAATPITVQSVVNTGLEATYSSADELGNYFINDGHTVLHVVNDSGGDITVTIDSPVVCDQGSYHDIEVVVTAGESRFIGVFDKNRFNDSEGRVSATYSAYASLTVAALKIY